MKQSEVARKHDVDPSSVSRWAKELRESGASSLKRRNAPGKSSFLTLAQWAEVTKAINEGASVHGFRGDSWTGPRVQRFIVERFGVAYNSNYLVGRARRLSGWASRHMEPERRNGGPRPKHRSGAGRGRSLGTAGVREGTPGRPPGSDSCGPSEDADRPQGEVGST